MRIGFVRLPHVAARICFLRTAKDSDTIDVTIASLDDPAPFAPQKAIFLEDKLPWVVIDESIPSFQTVPKKKPND